MAIKNFKHKGLKNFFYNDDRSKLNANHIEAVGDILDSLEASHHPIDMKAIFGAEFDEKKGSGKGVYSVKVNGQWRITYEIENDGAVIVDYLDYHGKKIKAKK